MDQHDPKVRRVVWLPLVFAFTSLMTVAVIGFTYIVQPNWQSLVVLISSLVVLGLDLFCFFLFRRGRVTQGAWLILVTAWWNLALSGAFYQGMGVILSISIIFLTLLVMTQAFEGRERVWAILIAAVLAYAVFGFDQLTTRTLVVGELTGFSIPWRVTTFPTQLTYPIMGSMLLAAAVVLAIQFRNFTLTGKLITSFLGITVVVAVLLAAMMLVVSQGRLRELISHQLEFSAASQGVIIGDDLYKQIAMLKSLPLDQAFVKAIEDSNASYTGSEAEIGQQIQKLDEEWIAAADIYEPLIWDRLNRPVSRDLRGFRILFPDHAEVFITDRYGAIVATTSRTSDYNQADEGWWQSAYKDGAGDTYIGAPEYDESSQTYAVKMAIAVRNDDNQVVGVLRSTFNVRAIINIVNSAKIGETGEFDLVIPGETTTMFHQGKTELATSEVLAAMQSLEDKTYIEGNYQGEASLLSQGSVRTGSYNSEITNLDWRILVHQTAEEAYSPVQSQLQVSLMVIYLLVGVMAVVGYGVSLILSRPITHLTRVAEQVSAGDLTVRASVESADKEHPRDEIGVLAKTFNSMTGQLQELVGSLEQRVADRTQAIVTSTEVSRRLSTILDQQELVSQVVEQVQSAFNYYHAHIYLFDEAHENLVMVGGTGEAGRTMLARGHKIPAGRGLVGRAAHTQMPVLVANTRSEPNWLPNPLLPDTQAEVAIPIMAGDAVLGVLDVQHNVVGGLTQADVDLLQSIASQVAIAFQNARSFAEAQRQAEREAMFGTISQKIRQTTTVDEALQVTVRELGRVVGAPQTRVRLGLATQLQTPAEGGWRTPVEGGERTPDDGSGGTLAGGELTGGTLAGGELTGPTPANGGPAGQRGRSPKASLPF
jgi:putative methionine-R-sulfoxide reductase with GAF domain